jgi:hypothetical protein
MSGVEKVSVEPPLFHAELHRKTRRFYNLYDFLDFVDFKVPGETPFIYTIWKNLRRTLYMKQLRTCGESVLLELSALM